MKKEFYIVILAFVFLSHSTALWALSPNFKLEISEVKRLVNRTCRWQMNAYPNMDENRIWKSAGDLSWENGVFLSALSRWAEFVKEPQMIEWYESICNRNYYGTSQNRLSIYHADDFAVCMMYVTLYNKVRNQRILQHTQARLDYTINHPSEIQFGDTTACKYDRWTWCDALYMAPPVYAKLYMLTGDKKYIKFMNREYKATYDYLFDKEENLFYRDWRYFDKREANGKKVFWGRGNGWVLGGLVEILKELPKKDKNRKFYEELFVKLATRVAGLQHPDGFWHASLLDPASYPSPETSCTTFIVYSIAYGINEGLLDKEIYLPVMIKGWNALVSAVEPNGKLGYVQQIGADPKKVTRDMTEVYGVGAFLMAGNEIYKMAR